MSRYLQRWLISILGLMAIAIVIWLLGPLIGVAGAGHIPLETPTARLLFILVIVLIWGLNNLRQQRQAMQANKHLIDGLLKSSPGIKTTGQQEEEVALIRGRFEEAMAILKQSRRKRGSRNLRDQPWYIIIGPPGCGKTTALAHSGLHFPLAKRFGTHDLKLRGIGGTRNCDWWFTDEAILLDTAGRYVTQDSHTAVDSAAWISFLDLLKNYRRRRPINGVLVAISLSDLMLQDEYERRHHVESIRQRIDELYNHFGIRFPIYVVLTKCDLVAGFSEFFDDLDVDGRSQVWGFTFDLEDELDNKVLHQRIGREYNHLIQRLNDLLLMRLHRERDVRRRNLIYVFPQQMAALKAIVQQFLGDIFRSTQAEQSPLLRGVYFTSGTQEGTPIDRLMGTLARTFGLEQHVLPSYAGHGRSYFIKGLLAGVVFPEAEIAGVNQRLESRLAWIQRVAYTVVIGLSATALLIGSTRFTANKFYINRVSEEVTQYQMLAAEPLSDGAEFLEILPRLDALLAAVMESRKYSDDVPLYMRGFLYQGEGLGNAVSDAYQRELNTILLPRITAQLEGQLRLHRDNPHLLYEALKIYLMLGDPNKLNAEHIALWMQLYWQATFPTQIEVQQRLQTHLEDLFRASVRPVDLNVQAIADARSSLLKLSLAEFIYLRLQRDYGDRHDLAFRMVEAIGANGDRVFMHADGPISNIEIPGLYTYRGYHEVFQKFSQQLVDEIHQERWVLGEEGKEITSAELESLGMNLKELYLKDYIRVWKDLLSSIDLVRFDTLEQAIELFSMLASSVSPLQEFISAVERNTTLSRLPANSLQVKKSLTEETNRMRNRLTGLLGSSEQEPRPALRVSTSQVEWQFKSLNRLVQSEAGRPPIDQITRIISDLYDHLEAINREVIEDSPIQSMIGGGGRDSIQRLEIEATRQPEPVKRWLTQLASNSRRIAEGNTRSRLNALWQAEVVPQCRSLLENRYPLNKQSSREVTLRDFGRFFGHGGIMDLFFSEHLEPLVDSSSQPWQWRAIGKASLGLSDGSLLQFERANRIRETFFQQGGQDPNVSFHLKPMYLDKQVSRFLLDIDGQQFVYRFGPTRYTKAYWPGPSGSRRVRVLFDDRNGERHVRSEEGQWAWFRILDSAHLEEMMPERFIVTFEVDGRQAKYEIRPDSALNPFLTVELQKFRCPASL